MPLNVFTVHAGNPLADEVVRYVRERVGDNPLDLTDVTIWVPSPRTAQAMRDAFMRASGQGLLLPQIRMLSFNEDDADDFRFEQENTVGEGAINGLSRLMVLAKLVQSKDPSLPLSRALISAGELAKLFNRFTTYDISLNDVNDIIPPELANHWQSNLDFFKIAFEFYPQWLKLNNRVDGSIVAKETLAAQVTDYQTKGMPHLTIAAGFSDTTPAGLSLIKEILRHENGVLVLSGLDLSMKDDSFDDLSVRHPQYTMKQMLQQLNLQRSDVQVLGEDSPLKAELWKRALAPSDQLRKVPTESALKAVSGLTLIESPNAQEEAEAIALLMRETLEHEGKTCALISPDRSLAVRVEACMKRWAIDVDDSAGVPLLSASLGSLFSLIAQVVAEKFRPTVLAELLHHPLATFGQDTYTWKKQCEALEMLVLRGSKPSSGLVGLESRLKLVEKDPFKPTDLAPLAQQCIDVLKEVFDPFIKWGGAQTVPVWLHAHVDVLKLTLKKSDVDDGLDVLADESGEALTGLLDQWQGASTETGAIDLDVYVETLGSLMAQAVVRKRHASHPRLAIWGPMEARMQAVDRVIIGAVNEGAWPRKVQPDPWLNRALSEKLGLPTADMHVGMSAHDFMTLASAKEVFMTRTVKDAEGETVPSRFLSRFEAVVEPDVLDVVKGRGQIWLDRVAGLRTEGEASNVSDAQVTVPLAKRPTVWSASLVRDLMQCPYKAYVRKILKLQKQDGLESEPTAADKGQIIHAILEAFYIPVEGLPAPYEGDLQNEKAVYEHLLSIAKQLFTLIDQQAIKALWWKKFELIAKDFAKRTAELNKNGQKLYAVEKEAKVPLSKHVSLYARADRLDEKDGRLTVIDYKTGTPPTGKSVLSGQEPQMAVEAVIATEGGYGDFSHLANLEYWHVSGAKANPINIKRSIGAKADLEDFVDEAGRGLKNLAEHFSEASTPYTALPVAQDKQGACKMCDYAGVCRFRDWVNHG